MIVRFGRRLDDAAVQLEAHDGASSWASSARVRAFMA
jgi:hypothetical protein